MTNEMIITSDASKMTRELFELVDRSYKEKPDPKDLRELRKKLEEIPELWRAVFDMVELIRNNWFDKVMTSKAARMGIERNVSFLMEGMDYMNASTLEKLLIDNVIITWLHLQWVEYQLVNFMGEGEVRMSVVKFWEKILSASQRRHLRACETLARVRQLLLVRPGLQVNIATQRGQQVNLAGDLVKK